MDATLSLTETTIAKKAIIAITGVILVGFVVIHMLGNLQVYLGPEVLNEYSAFLKSKPLVLWGARMVLLVSVVTHIGLTLMLANRNGRARKVGYAKHSSATDSILERYASRTMVWSGPILLFFIVYHILHLTIGFTPGYAFSETDVYSNLVQGFQNAYISIVYIVAMLALGMHLYHGVFSVFQTLGVQHKGVRCWSRTLAFGLALFIPLGYASIPVSVILGVLK